MQNPLRFGHKKAAVEAVAADAKAGKPMITGGLAMTLKSLGVDPAMVDETARDLINAIGNAGERLATVERQNLEILALLRAQQSSSENPEA